MSTANFSQGTLNKLGLPLIVGGMGNDYDARKKTYEKDNGEEYPPSLYQAEVDADVEFYDENAKELNANLKHFEIVIESGYYQGWQFNVKETDPYNDWESIECIDNDSAEYFYGVSVDEIKAEFAAELDKIKEFLKSKVCSPYVIELNCVGVYSNGEAVYREANNA